MFPKNTTLRRVVRFRVLVVRVLLLQTLDDLRRLVEAAIRILSANEALRRLAELLDRALLAEVVSTATHHQRTPTRRRHHRVHELLPANEAGKWQLLLVAAFDHVFVVLVIIVNIYASVTPPPPTLSSLALLSLLLLLLFPVAVLLLTPSPQSNNLPTHLVVTAIVDELARVTEGAVSRLLVVLADLFAS